MLPVHFGGLTETWYYVGKKMAQFQHVYNILYLRNIMFLRVSIWYQTAGKWQDKVLEQKFLMEGVEEGAKQVINEATVPNLKEEKWEDEMLTGLTGSALLSVWLLKSIKHGWANLLIMKHFGILISLCGPLTMEKNQ